LSRPSDPNIRRSRAATTPSSGRTNPAERERAYARVDNLTKCLSPAKDEPSRRTKFIKRQLKHMLSIFIATLLASFLSSHFDLNFFRGHNTELDQPRSICLALNRQRLCTSWATYSLDRATLEDDEVWLYSRQCAESGGSAEYKTHIGDGGMIFVCVDQRMPGCN